MKRSKLHLVVALALIGAALVGGPYILQHLHLMSELKPKAWLVLAVAYVGILIKYGVGYLTTKHFRYDKSAYDISMLVFAGGFTCIALQIGSPTDLFPGLEDISFLKFASTLGVSIVQQHLVLLGILVVMGLVGTIVSAMGIVDTDDGRSSGGWTLCVSIVAHASMWAYALALISKG